MDPRGALAKLFLAGRSPEEQAARMARQRQQSGLGGAPGGAAIDPIITGASGPGGGAPVPTPRPSQFSLPQQAPIPTPSPGMFPPDLAVSPPHPADPMAASAPTNATLPFVPGSSRMPPDLGVSPLMPPDPMAASAPTNNPPPLPEIAPSPPRPRDPMAASAPTEIGAYEAQKQFRLPKKKSRKEQTKDASDKFKKKLGPRQFGLG